MLNLMLMLTLELGLVEGRKVVALERTSELLLELLGVSMVHFLLMAMLQVLLVALL